MFESGDGCRIPRLWDRIRARAVVLTAEVVHGADVRPLPAAPNTAKTHMRAVYTKLDATSWRDAVDAGRHRGALDSRLP
jgi:hypothetical protein